MLPIIFSFILAATHFWNEKIQIHQEHVRTRIISFVAGISVTYVFLNLLPEVYGGFELFDQLIFIFPLAGFSTAHLAEKYIYQHSAPQTLKEKLSGVHSIAFFFYHFFLGVILVKLSQISNLDAVLFFLPVVFYAAVGLVSLEKIHSKVWERFSIKFLLSLSTLFGALLAERLISFEQAFDILFGFIIGVFLYIVLIDFVPKEAKGRPEYFALGVAIYTLIISATFV
jgi:zinc transporter ZupT